MSPNRALNYLINVVGGLRLSKDFNALPILNFARAELGLRKITENAKKSRLLLGIVVYDHWGPQKISTYMHADCSVTGCPDRKYCPWGQYAQTSSNRTDPPSYAKTSFRGNISRVIFT